MGSEAIWKSDANRIHSVAAVVRGGRAATVQRGARLSLVRGAARPVASTGGTTIANPRPFPSKAVTDRAALFADIAVRRRRAQMAARHALAGAASVRVAEPLAS
jgi:hypothetical protein